MTRNPSLRCQLREYRTGCLMVLLVNFLLFFTFRVLVQVLEGGEATLNGSAFTYIIFMFVIGIVMPRPFLRLGIQLGVSRRTSFRNSLVSAALAALFLAVCDDLMVLLFQALVYPNFQVSHLYALLYTGSTAPLPFPQQILSLLFSACLMFFCWTAGCFFTFLFWRLNTFGCVLAGLAIPVVLTAVPLLLYCCEPLAPVASLLNAWGSQCLAFPWVAMVSFLVLAALLTLLSWLLVRNVNIRGTALK